MEYLALIEFQSVDLNRDLLISQFQKLINEMDKNTGKLTIKAYSAAKSGADFNIHLFHNSKEVENSGSTLGLRLISALKKFGLVNQSIWVEMNTNNQNQISNENYCFKRKSERWPKHDHAICSLYPEEIPAA